MILEELLNLSETRFLRLCNKDNNPSMEADCEGYSDCIESTKEQMLPKGSKYPNCADSKSHILCPRSCYKQEQVGLEDFTKKDKKNPQDLAEPFLIQMIL